MDEKKSQGWMDVVITPDMPLSVLVNFMNVLNQRLVTIEDQIIVDFEGSKKTLTEVYKIQAEREMEAQTKAKESEGK